MSKSFNWWDGQVFIRSRAGVVNGEIATGYTVQDRQVYVAKIDAINVTFNTQGYSNVIIGTNCYEILEDSVFVYYPFNDDADIWRKLPAVNKDAVGQQVQIVFGNTGNIQIRRRGGTNNLRVRGYVVYTKKLPTDS